MIGNPEILLADEPTGNLDSTNADAVMRLLSDIHRDGTTVCLVTHDARYASGATRTEACRAAGIHRGTLRRWLRVDQALREVITLAEEQGAEARSHRLWLRHAFRG